MSSVALLSAHVVAFHLKPVAFFAIHPLFSLPYIAPFCFQYINWRTELSSKLYETYIDPSTKSICIRFPKNSIQICAGTIRVYASLQQNGTGYTGVSTKIEQSTFPKPFKFLRGCTITQNSDDWVMIIGKTTTLNGISQLRLGYFAAYTNKAFYMDYIAIGTY